jgi:hypothetical protein
MTQQKIIIVVEGGLVKYIYSNNVKELNPVQIAVVDLDDNGDGPDISIVEPDNYLQMDANDINWMFSDEEPETRAGHFS